MVTVSYYEPRFTILNRIRNYIDIHSAVNDFMTDKLIPHVKKVRHVARTNK